MKLLMIDNYDSFTYNIVQYFGELGAQVEVFRNDEITLQGIADRAPDRLVISPGPCSPAEAGISVAAWLPAGVRAIFTTRRSDSERLRVHRPLASSRSSMRVMAPASRWHSRASSATVLAWPRCSFKTGIHCAWVSAELTSCCSTPCARLVRICRIMSPMLSSGR